MKVKKTVPKHLALGPDRLGEVTEKHSQKQDVASPRWPLLKVCLSYIQINSIFCIQPVKFCQKS